jgi:NitT/TauT family transport system ATP-binding protein
VPDKIRLHAVEQRFGTGDTAVQALAGLDLDLAPGEFVSVVGQSGCGKSTLLRLIAGLLEPSAGQIERDGQPLQGVSADHAIVFQRPVLLDWRSVLDNVLLPAELAGQPRAQVEPRARALLQVLGLTGFERKRPRQLSGGMQQRAALARALLTDPTLLLLDEPFSALDAITREQLQAELQRVWSSSGATALLVTHDIAEAVFLSDRVALMTNRPGRIARLVDIPLPRPRTLDLRFTPEFTTLCRELRLALEASANGERQAVGDTSTKSADHGQRAADDTAAEWTEGRRCPESANGIAKDDPVTRGFPSPAHGRRAG